MVVPVSAVFAAILGLLLLALSLLVVRYRIRYRQTLGVNDDPAFVAAVRAQANLAEYAPLGLVMLVVAELNGVAAGLVYWTGMVLVLGRLLHAWGMVDGQGSPHKARAVGTLLTWLALLATVGLLLWNVYQVNR